MCNADGNHRTWTARLAAALALLLAASALLSGCGQPRTQAATPPAPASAELPDLGELDALRLRARSAPRATSLWPPPNYREFKGADYFLACPGATLRSGTELQLPLPDATASWAIYAVDGLVLGGTTVAGWSLLTGTSFPEDTFMAIANYRTGRWEMRQGVRERQFQVLGDRGDYISPAGRFYLAVFGWQYGYTPGDLIITHGSFVLDDGSALAVPNLMVEELPGALGVEFNTWDLRTTGYQLRVTGPGRDETLEFTYFNDVAQHFITGLAAGKEYAVAVRALSSSGHSAEAGKAGIPTPGWQHTLHAGATTEFTRGCGLPDGGFIAANSYLLARYRPDGAFIASAMFEHATVTALMGAGDGGLFIAGQLPHPNPAYPLLGSAFLARLNPDLSASWVRAWDAERNYRAGPSIVCTDDAIYVANADTIRDGSIARVVALRRFELDGTLAWSRWRDAGPDEDVEVNSLAVTADGAVWAGGWRMTGEAGGDAGSLLLTQWSAAGAINWERRLSLPVSQVPGEIYALCPDGTGGVFAGSGESDEYGEHSLHEQAALLRVAADGSLVWQRVFTGSTGSSFHALLPDGAGGVWTGGNGQPGNGYGSGLIIRWDGAGAVRDLRELGNSVKGNRLAAPSIAALVPGTGGALVAIGNGSGMSGWWADESTASAQPGPGSWQSAAAVARNYTVDTYPADLLPAVAPPVVEHDLLRGSHYFNGGGWYNGLVFSVEP